MTGSLDRWGVTLAKSIHSIPSYFLYKRRVTFYRVRKRVGPTVLLSWELGNELSKLKFPNLRGSSPGLGLNTSYDPVVGQSGEGVSDGVFEGPLTLFTSPTVLRHREDGETSSQVSSLIGGRGGSRYPGSGKVGPLVFKIPLVDGTRTVP